MPVSQSVPTFGAPMSGRSGTAQLLSQNGTDSDHHSTHAGTGLGWRRIHQPLCRHGPETPISMDVLHGPDDAYFSWPPIVTPASPFERVVTASPMRGGDSTDRQRTACRGVWWPAIRLTWCLPGGANLRYVRDTNDLAGPAQRRGSHPGGPAGGLKRRQGPCCVPPTGASALRSARRCTREDQ